MSNAGKSSKVRHVRARTVVCLLLLLLILLVAGVFIFSYTPAGSSGQARKNITATPQQGTVISTGQSITKPLFSDDFSDLDKGWAVGSASGYTRAINNGALTLANENHTTLTESLPTNLTFDDFSLTVTFTILQATADDSVGLYVRGDSNLDHDYRVDFYMDRTYAVSKEYLDKQNAPQETLLQPSTFASSLRPLGEPNIATLIMKGPIMVLIINNHVVLSVADNAYTSGQIALFVHNSFFSSEVEAVFSSVVVFPAPFVLPRQ